MKRSDPPADTLLAPPLQSENGLPDASRLEFDERVFKATTDPFTALTEFLRLDPNDVPTLLLHIRTLMPLVRQHCNALETEAVVSRLRKAFGWSKAALNRMLKDPSVWTPPLLKGAEPEEPENPWDLADQIALLPMRDRRPFLERWLKAVASRDRPEQVQVIVTKAKALFNLPIAMVDEALAQLTRPASDESTGPLSVEAIAQLREDAASILEAENPLEAIKKELRRLGLGGDPKPGLVLYLAGTGRVLGKRKGAIQAHGQVIAEAGSGKSYLSDLVFSTYPARAVVRYSASSPKVLLRDTRPLQHRVILYSEMDSIPGAQSGDDEQAAASAIRELLQNDELIYHVVGKDDAGRSVVEVCRRAGPTALFTTTTRRASSRQFDSRLFALELDTTSQQLREALDAQADLELTDELPAPTPAVVAVQAYLQALAPLDVVIPYIRPLHALLQVSRVDVRILRDAARLRTLIKAATLLHIAQRERNAAGRLIATYDDYQLVIDLLADTYEHTVTGVTEKMRELVATVAANPGSSQTKLASLLQVSQSAIAQRVKVALERRWLADTAWPRGLGYAQQLQVGEPLPHPCGLPSVEQLKAWKPQAQRVAWGAR